LSHAARKQAAAPNSARLCLVVHDDLELRLRLAGLVRRAAASLDADALSGAGLQNLSVEQLRSYVAVMVVVEFMQRGAEGDPLGVVTRLRARAPLLPIFVFARQGDERCAARAMKAGAADYWPIHAVDLNELAAALRPLLEQPGEPLPSPPKAAHAVIDDASAYPSVAGYRLLKKIAHSSSASVYLARNSDLAQRVALKVQPIQGLTSVSEEDRQRFARECEILSSLNHRSVADVIDFGITPNYLYLALEYFPCGSMRERLKNPVSERDALNYARQIASALQVVHAAGIVHRDLKPSNLMLTTDNRVVLIDFGSAPITSVRSKSMAAIPISAAIFIVWASSCTRCWRAICPFSAAIWGRYSRGTASVRYRRCRPRNPIISRSSTGCSRRSRMSALLPLPIYSMP